MHQGLVKEVRQGNPKDHCVNHWNFRPATQETRVQYGQGAGHREDNNVH